LKSLFRFVRSRLSGMDVPLLFLCLTASVYGLLLLYSATYSFETTTYLKTQLAALFLGVVGYFALSMMDPRRLLAAYPVVYFLHLLLLLSLLFFGLEEGNRSWIRVGGVGLQPAELGKFLLILSLAGHLSDAHQNGMRGTDLLLLTLHALSLPACVVVFSRDDGMTLAYLATILSMTFAAGLRLRVLFAAAVSVAALLPLLWTFFLNTYQKARILAILRPEDYPDTAYQAMQTVRAITSGGVTGRGYLQGDRTQVSLIPTKHTDSIIAVAGEELGFVGCAAVLLLLALVLQRCFSVAFRAKDRGLALAVYGAAGMLSFQIVLNIGMNLGLLPIIGLTLPFFSYGGTSMLTMFLTMGLVSAVHRINQTEYTGERRRKQ